MKPVSRDTPLQGAKRTIAVIKALNMLELATVSEISRLSGISRQSVYRILAALEEEGLASRHPSKEVWRLDLGIRRLTESLRDEDWVLDIAAPILNRLQRIIVWPTDFSTIRGTEMIIRHTSRRHSPLVIDKATVGLTLPILETAMGLAFLAWSSEREREEIISSIRQSEQPHGLVNDEPGLWRLLETTRERGYATRPGNFMPSTRSMAVPVLLEGRVIGAIAYTWIASSCRISEAVERYLPALRAAQSQLSKDLEDAHIGLHQITV